MRRLNVSSTFQESICYTARFGNCLSTRPTTAKPDNGGNGFEKYCPASRRLVRRCLADNQRRPKARIVRRTMNAAPRSPSMTFSDKESGGIAVTVAGSTGAGGAGAATACVCTVGVATTCVSTVGVTTACVSTTGVATVWVTTVCVITGVVTTVGAGAGGGGDSVSNILGE
jgi:hypothetical protein